MVRALTYGPAYAFGVGCRSDAYRARIEWEVDLTKLPVRALSEQEPRRVRGWDRFEATLPDAGKRLRFRLLTGDDERRLPALQRSAPDKLLSAVLAYSRSSWMQTRWYFPVARSRIPTRNVRKLDRRTQGACWW
jgi:hypothetical protein